MIYTIHRIFLIVLVLCLIVFTACAKQERADKVISVADDDPEMNAAIENARASLPSFWKIFEHPVHGETGFSLKARMKDGSATEHFWLIDIQRVNGKIAGVINNDPDTVKSVKLGQRVEIPEADISDWLYMRDGKMYGNRTLRPLLKSMPPQEVERLKSIMADE